MNDSFSYYVQKYFTSYLIGENDFGKNTISSYRDTFKLLVKFLESSVTPKKNLPITKIDKERVLAFLKWLEIQRGNSKTTRNIRLAHLKSFYHYTQKSVPELAFLCESIRDISFAITEKKPPVFMSEDAVGHLLASVDKTSSDGIRHLAILALLYDSGCRVQELIDLKVSDVQLDKYRQIYVHGKGDKYRNILILPETAVLLIKYISIYKLESSDWLFSNRGGNQLTRQGIRYILRKYTDLIKSVCSEKAVLKAHPHLMRHSKATHLVHRGINIYNVKDFLGHESVETTQIYVTSSPEVTRNAIEHASSKTVPDSTDFYTQDEKQVLMDFLDTIV